MSADLSLFVKVHVKSNLLAPWSEHIYSGMQHDGPEINGSYQGANKGNLRPTFMEIGKSDIAQVC